MKNDDIRKKIFHQLRDVKQLSLTENQIKIIKFTKGGALSSDVSDKFGICTTAASNLLAKLYSKGYLDRVEQLAPTGGIQYMYQTRF